MSIDELHLRGVPELNQKLVDNMLVLRKAITRLIRFLEENDTTHMTGLMIVRRSFGRVMELWCLDMGVECVDNDFQLTEEVISNNNNNNKKKIKIRGVVVTRGK